MGRSPFVSSVVPGKKDSGGAAAAVADGVF